MDSAGFAFFFLVACAVILSVIAGLIGYALGRMHGDRVHQSLAFREGFERGKVVAHELHLQATARK